MPSGTNVKHKTEPWETKQRVIRMALPRAHLLLLGDLQSEKEQECYDCAQFLSLKWEGQNGPKC